MGADFFPVITSAETTAEMVYITPEICGILYPSSFGIKCTAVIHGLRTESGHWGLEADSATVKVYGGLSVQINGSNHDWETDCGRHCPAVKRHISDFRTQRFFTFHATTGVADIVSRMERSGVVWRPLRQCRNANCLNCVEGGEASLW